jgi:hypothetical protein
MKAGAGFKSSPGLVTKEMERGEPRACLDMPDGSRETQNGKEDNCVH